MNAQPSRAAGWAAEFLEVADRRNSEIAESFHVTERTVVRWRTRMGVNLREPATPHSLGDRERARQLLDEGCSRAEVGRTLGVAGRTVHRWFPDEPGWSKAQAGAHGVMVRRLNVLEREMADGA